MSCLLPAQVERALVAVNVNEPEGKLEVLEVANLQDARVWQPEKNGALGRAAGRSAARWGTEAILLEMVALTAVAATFLVANTILTNHCSGIVLIRRLAPRMAAKSNQTSAVQAMRPCTSQPQRRPRSCSPTGAT